MIFLLIDLKTVTFNGNKKLINFLNISYIEEKKVTNNITKVVLKKFEKYCWKTLDVTYIVRERKMNLEALNTSRVVSQWAEKTASLPACSVSQASEWILLSAHSGSQRIPIAAPFLCVLHWNENNDQVP